MFFPVKHSRFCSSFIVGCFGTDAFNTWARKRNALTIYGRFRSKIRLYKTCGLILNLLCSIRAYLFLQKYFWNIEIWVFTSDLNVVYHLFNMTRIDCYLTDKIHVFFQSNIQDFFQSPDEFRNKTHLNVLAKQRSYCTFSTQATLASNIVRRIK